MRWTNWPSNPSSKTHSNLPEARWYGTYRRPRGQTICSLTKSRNPFESVHRLGIAMMTNKKTVSSNVKILMNWIECHFGCTKVRTLKFKSQTPETILNEIGDFNCMRTYLNLKKIQEWLTWLDADFYQNAGDRKMAGNAWNHDWNSKSLKYVLLMANSYLLNVGLLCVTLNLIGSMTTPKLVDLHS